MEQTQWLIKKPFRLNEDSAWLIERYLFGSLAIGASRLGGDFNQVLHVKNSYQAKQLLGLLEDDGFAFEFKDSAEQVTEAIEKMRSESNRFWELREFFICTRTKKAETNRVIELLSEFKENEESKLGFDGNKIVKNRFFEVDSVFRYIRNALAHGCFNTHEICGEKAVFLFNISGDRVSAIASLRFSRLHSWYEQLCAVAGTEL